MPRHPERFEAVHVLCQREGFASVRRSSGQPVGVSDQVLLGDSMGELLFLYALADVAFVGGSLVPNGGHNLLEPAALSLPVLSGSHLFNFLEIAAQMREAGALVEVADGEALMQQLRQLLASDAWRQSMAEAGLGVLKANQGALVRLLGGLECLLGASVMARAR
ncbi:3-deoxy-D-manno-octulosonic acid transferase [compost metagenome]